MDAGAWIAILAAAISLMSAVTAVYQAQLAREQRTSLERQYREMNEPRLELSMRPGGLWLANPGFGPAVITGTSVTYKQTDRGPWTEATANNIGAEVSGDVGVHLSKWTFEDGKWISPGEESLVFAARQYQADQAQLIREVLARDFAIEVSYRSAIDDQVYSAHYPPGH